MTSNHPHLGRRRRLCATFLVAGLLAAACGSDKNSSPSTTAAAAATTTTAASTATTAATTSTGASTAPSDTTASSGAATNSTAATDPTTASSGSAGGTPTPGGELTYLVPIESPSMDPCAWDNSGQGTNGLRAIAIYDSLVRLNNDTLEFEMKIAESLKPNTDFSVWTLKIRSGVRFSDGTDFNADAVKAQWTRLGDPAAKCASAGQVANIASMTVKDPLTLEIALKAPSSSFIDTVSSRLGAIPSPTALAKSGADFAANPVGAGPFVVKSWVKDDQMVLEKNADYYQKAAGLPYLDKVTIRPLLDEDQRANSLKAGDADLAFTQIGTTIKSLEDAGVAINKFYLQGAEPLIFNTKKAPFDDIRVRQAVAMSVDPAQLSQVVFGGSIEPAKGLFYAPSPYASEVKWPAPDCEAAKALWAQLAKEKGGPIEITIGAFNQGQPPSVEFMQAAITKCGGDSVKIKLDIVDAAAAVERIFAGNYEAHGWGIQFVRRPDAILVQLRCGSPRNTTGFCSKEFDALLDKAATLSDNAQLAPLYNRAEQILAEQLPVFFYKRSVVAGAHSDKVHGVTITEDGIIPLEGIWKDK